MAASTFGRVMLHLLSLAPDGWPAREHPAPSSRSTRRTIATVAEVLQLDLQSRLALGSWQDDFSLS
eukprot:1780310-Heterocapsa_arctica.AAC.1